MMGQYEQLAGRISDALSRGLNLSAEELADVSAAYAVATDTLNDRLRHAAALLGRGLREEAIQECEREPNLLDAIDMLDIHDQELWCNMHRHHGVVLPSPMSVQQAAELNSAYAEQAPLANLLRKHRLLALGHASLKSRIQLLSQIAAKDTSNELWDSDLKVFQAARISEIKASLPKVEKSRELVAAQQIEREINTSDWRIQVPEDLKKETRRILHCLEAEAARETLRRCSAQLREAFAEFDSTKGFELQQKWDEHLRSAALPPSNPLLVETQPALNWLDEQREQLRLESEQQELLSEFEALLDDEETPRSEIETTYVRLDASDAEVPSVLLSRYRNRLDALQTKESQAQTLRMVGTIGTLAILAGIIFFALKSYQFSDQVRQTVAELDGHRTERRWREGTALVESIEESAPEVFRTIAFQDAQKNFDTALNEDQTRRSEFEKLVAEIRLGGVVISDTPEIQALKKLAITPEELKLCTELDAEKDRHDAAKEAAEKEAFQRLIQTVDEQFQGNPSLDVEQLKDLVNQIRDAREKHPYATRNRLDNSEFPEFDQALEARISQKIIELQRSDRIANSLEKATDNVGRSIQNHVFALIELENAFGDSVIGEQLLATLSEKSLWLAASELSDLANEFKDRVHSVSVSEARDALAAFLEIKKKYQVLPSQFTSFEQQLSRAAKRSGLLNVNRLVPEALRDPDAPHSNLISALLDGYESISSDGNNWDAKFLTILDRIYKDEEVQPTLRLKLYRVALQKAAEGSYAFELGFKPILDELHSRKASKILLDESGDSAREFLSDLKHSDARAAVIRIIQQFGRLSDEFTWTGWLRPAAADEDRAVFPAVVTPIESDGDLFILLRNQKGEADYVKFGAIERGDTTISARSLLQAGRPIYLKRKQ